MAQENLTKLFVKPYKEFFKLNGTVNIIELWFGIIGLTLGFIVITSLAMLLNLNILIIVYATFTLWALMSMIIKRLRHRGSSIWWVLLFPVPSRIAMQMANSSGQIENISYIILLITVLVGLGILSTNK